MEIPTDKVVGAATSKLSAEEGESRVEKQLSEYRKTGQYPTEPKYRVSLLEGGIVIGACALVDFIDWVAGMTIVGEVIVIVLDMIWAAILASYCKFRLKMGLVSHPTIYISIVGAELVNNIPLVNAAWWLDGWYIVRTVRAEDRATHQELIQIIDKERQDEAQEKQLRIYEENLARAREEEMEEEEFQEQE